MNMVDKVTQLYKVDFINYIHFFCLPAGKNVKQRRNYKYVGENRLVT